VHAILRVKVWFVSSDKGFGELMRLFKHTEPKPGAGSTERRVDPSVLRDGRLLAEWYILHRLDEELERSRRHDRPLSVIVVAPMLLSGERPTSLELEVAAAAASAASRSSDLLGRLGRDSILMIMPETSREGARVAAFRWRSDMSLHGRRVGAHKWEAVIMENLGDFETGEQLIRAATDRLSSKDPEDAA
jgi:hypothetical protein